MRSCAPPRCGASTPTTCWPSPSSPACSLSRCGAGCWPLHPCVLAGQRPPQQLQPAGDGVQQRPVPPGCRAAADPDPYSPLIHTQVGCIVSYWNVSVVVEALVVTAAAVFGLTLVAGALAWARAAGAAALGRPHAVLLLRPGRQAATNRGAGLARRVSVALMPAAFRPPRLSPVFGKFDLTKRGHILFMVAMVVFMVRQRAVIERTGLAGMRQRWLVQRLLGSAGRPPPPCMPLRHPAAGGVRHHHCGLLLCQQVSGGASGGSVGVPARNQCCRWRHRRNRPDRPAPPAGGGTLQSLWWWPCFLPLFWCTTSRCGGV